MRDGIRFYDRTLSRLSRRELLNIAWKLGTTAVLQPLVARSVQAQAICKSSTA
jgi:hypothetical protein